jgi:hypothetical protein
MIMVLGLITLVAAYQVNDPWKSLLTSIAAVILTSGIFSTLGTYLARARVVEELSKQFGVLLDVVRLGVVRIAWWPIEIPQGCKKVDILVARAHGWTSENIPRFSEILREKESKVRICVVHPRSAVIPILASKYGEFEKDVSKKINDSVKVLVECAEDARKNGSMGRLIVKGHKLVPTHTYYRFDDQLNIVWYAMAKGRLKVPWMELTDGKIARFFAEDYDRLMSDDQVETLYDSDRTALENARSLETMGVDKLYIKRVLGV